MENYRKEYNLQQIPMLQSDLTDVNMLLYFFQIFLFCKEINVTDRAKA